MRSTSLPSLLVTYGLDGDGLVIRVLGQSAESFTRSVPWRAGMFLARACLLEVAEDALVFPSDLSYRKCLEIVDSLSSGAEYGVEVELDESFQQFIAESQTHIEERSKVGVAIKTRSDSIENEYRLFSDVVNEAMERPLRERQMLDAFFMATVRWSANFSVPGSGKTASVLGAFVFLRSLEKVKRVVVVCPKSAFESWRMEWLACFGDRLPMNSFCLGDAEIARLTKSQKKSAVRFESGRYNLMLFNYEALEGYVDELREVVQEETLLVFDEVHRVKAIGGQRAGWAMAVAEPAQYVTVLTGTPIPNTYCDIYNMLHLLYPDDYDDFFGFTPGLLRDPAPWDIARINDAMRPFFCRTNKDELGVPRANPDEVHRLDAGDAESQLFNILSAAYSKNHLVLMIRVLQLESDPQMLRQALDPEDFECVLDQVGDDITDIDFVNYSSEVPVLINACGPSAKMLACEDLVARLVAEGKPVIVWCIFVKSIENIARDLGDLGISVRTIFGQTPQQEREAILDEFRAGMFQVLVTNPHTLAESVSLHNVCHDGVYFEYSYNLVHLLQSKDRIHRLGLPANQYTQYHFFQTFFDTQVGKWSLDAKIYGRLLEKERVMLEAIDGGYLEGGYVDEEDLEIVFGDLFGQRKEPSDSSDSERAASRRRAGGKRRISGSVVQVASRVRQPQGGYLPLGLFTERQLKDSAKLSETENISAGLVGIVVDLLTRAFSQQVYWVDGSRKETGVEEAFANSLLGAELMDDYGDPGHAIEAQALLSEIVDLSDASILSACKLARYEACFRAEAEAYSPPEDAIPDEDTIANIRTMVLRSIRFFDEVGPLTKAGATFRGAYTQVVTSGEADYLTNSTLWDIKVMKTPPKPKHTLQVLMYYLMGKRTFWDLEFLSITTIGIFNPRLNRAWTLEISNVPDSVLDSVEYGVMGYEGPSVRS